MRRRSPALLALSALALVGATGCTGESADRESFIVAMTRDGIDGDPTLSEPEAECVADIIFSDPTLAEQAESVGFAANAEEIDEKAPGFLDALAQAIADCT